MEKIPKKIHYIWVGGKPLPKRFQKNVDSWRKHNPEFEIMLWNEENIDFSHGFVRLALQKKKWSLLSEFVRIAAVKQYGGIYLDTDVFVLKSFQPFLTCSCFYGFQENGYINHAVFGAVPNHWFISRAYQYYIDLEPLEDDADIDSLGFGPDVINKLLREETILTPSNECSNEIFNSRDLTLYPKRYFYPYNWNEEFHDSCVTPDTASIHFWELSWHLEDRSWVRKQVTLFLKSNPTVFRKVKSTYRHLRSALERVKSK
jgi:mannosyltransferase OCH1-like enzyme